MSQSEKNFHVKINSYFNQKFMGFLYADLRILYNFKYEEISMSFQDNEIKTRKRKYEGI